jgi:hypothetical protein
VLDQAIADQDRNRLLIDRFENPLINQNYRTE